jgi:hypothetical protein
MESKQRDRTQAELRPYVSCPTHSTDRTANDELRLHRLTRDRSESQRAVFHEEPEESHGDEPRAELEGDEAAHDQCHRISEAEAKSKSCDQPMQVPPARGLSPGSRPHAWFLPDGRAAWTRAELTAYSREDHVPSTRLDR